MIESSGLRGTVESGDLTGSGAVDFASKVRIIAKEDCAYKYPHSVWLSFLLLTVTT
jgi:hypothetical protein